jgi:hypothetical protein
VDFMVILAAAAVVSFAFVVFDVTPDRLVRVWAIVAATLASVTMVVSNNQANDLQAKLSAAQKSGINAVAKSSAGPVDAKVSPDSVGPNGTISMGLWSIKFRDQESPIDMVCGSVGDPSDPLQRSDFKVSGLAKALAEIK